MKKAHKYILNFLNNSKDGFNLFKFALKLPLFLISYAVILFTKTKRALYNRSFIFKAKEPGMFTVSIGNINLGGAGKTPFSYTIAEYLYGRGLKPCIISRGYRGRLKKKSILPAGNMSLRMRGKSFQTK